MGPQPDTYAKRGPSHNQNRPEPSLSTYTHAQKACPEETADMAYSL